MKLGEAIYKAESEENTEPAGTAKDTADNDNNNDDDVFDADFEDLTDEKK